MPSRVASLIALASLVCTSAIGCSSQDAGVTCGEGTVLVGSQCRVKSPPPDEGGAGDAHGDSPSVDGGSEGGTGDDVSGDDGATGDDAPPDAPSETGPVVTACADGGGPAGDQCPSTAFIDCSNMCGGGAACPVLSNGCAWPGDAGAALQVDGTNGGIVRTPSGELDTTACSNTCGEAGAYEAAASFAITTAGQWVKITAPAPWRVVAAGGDVCHPVDNHCVLTKTGAMIVAPDACMPARNVVVEPISGSATCP